MQESPFSMQNQYMVKWGKQPPEDTIPAARLNDRHNQVLDRLSRLKFASRVQLARQLNGNLRKGKKSVDFLIDKKYLVEHRLISRENSRQIPFYSVSNPVLETFNEAPFQKMYTIDVLKRLLLAQFYVRFFEIDQEADILPFPTPFDACFTLFGKEFSIAVVREQTQIQRLFGHFKYMDSQLNSLIVFEDLKFADTLLKVGENSKYFRVTTDHNLLRDDDLSNSFHKCNVDAWQEISVPAFKIKKETEVEV